MEALVRQWLHASASRYVCVSKRRSGAPAHCGSGVPCASAAVLPLPLAGDFFHGREQGIPPEPEPEDLVIGSIVANIGLILGIAALVRPARGDGTLRRCELPVLVASAAIVPLLLLDDVLSRAEAGGLMLVAVGYTLWMVRAARSATSVAAAKSDVSMVGKAADAAGAPNSPGILRAALSAGVGLAVLLIGGRIFIAGAVTVAHALGVSDRLVGPYDRRRGDLLPERVTSVIAAVRGQSDLAVANVVGSNIFNTFLCLGIAGLVGAVGVPLHTLGIDLAALLLMTVLAATFIRTECTISRCEGVSAVALYAVFMRARGGKRMSRPALWTPPGNRTGLSGIAHALIGSVAEWIIQTTPCDVLVARPARVSFELP